MYTSQVSALYPNLGWEEFLARLGAQGWWFDHVAIQALARALEIDIHIISSAGPSYDSEAPATQLRVGRASVFVGHLVGRHYVALLSGTYTSSSFYFFTLHVLFCCAVDDFDSSGESEHDIDSEDEDSESPSELEATVDTHRVTMEIKDNIDDQWQLRTFKPHKTFGRLVTATTGKLQPLANVGFPQALTKKKLKDLVHMHKEYLQPHHNLEIEGAASIERVTGSLAGLETYSVDDVEDFLFNYGLRGACYALRAHEVDGRSFVALTEDELEVENAMSVYVSTV